KHQAQARHVQETGGHAQFAVWWLEVGPTPRGGRLELVDQIRRRVLANQPIPSVEHGSVKPLPHGVVPPYQPVDVRVTVYHGDLRSTTQGRAAFGMTCGDYDEVPSHLADKVVAEARKEKEEA